MVALPLTLMLLLAAGQTKPNPHLSKAEALLNEMRNEEALRVLDKARRWPWNSTHELAQVNLLLGLAHAGLADEVQAMRSFRTARLLDPQLQLPSNQSPRVRRWWHKAGPASDSPIAAREAQGPDGSVAPTRPPLIAPPESVRQPDTELPAPWKGWTGAVVAATAVVSFGIGALFANRSRDGLARAEQARRIDEAEQLHRAAAADARTANFLFGAGAVAGAGGLVVFSWSFAE